jgi:hypothetical protein
MIGVADPYRRRLPSDPPAPKGRGIELGTVLFGLSCAVLAVALAGKDGLKCALSATLAGTALILLRPDMQR